MKDNVHIHLLREAIYVNELPTIQEIFERYPELVNARVDDDGYTFLMAAVSSWERTPELVKYLLGMGANPKATTREGYTALHYAVDVDGETCYGDIPKQIIKLLVDAGADLEAKQHWGWTPLMRAVLEGTADEVQALCDVGAHVNVIFPEHTGPEYLRGDTVLMAVVYDPEIVRILVTAGADPRQKGLYGIDAIEHAAAELRRPKNVIETKQLVRNPIEVDPVLKNLFMTCGNDFLERALSEYQNVAIDHDKYLAESLAKSLRILIGLQ